MELRAHVEGMARGLFFHCQYDPVLGVTLEISTAAGRRWTVPLKVLEDCGAAPNLMTRTCAERCGITLEPSTRRVCGSTGASAR